MENTVASKRQSIKYLGRSAFAFGVVSTPNYLCAHASVVVCPKLASARQAAKMEERSQEQATHPTLCPKGTREHIETRTSECKQNGGRNHVRHTRTTPSPKACTTEHLMPSVQPSPTDPPASTCCDVLMVLPECYQSASRVKSCVHI
jgi:hypothetical protein